MNRSHESEVTTPVRPGLRRAAHRPRGGVLVLVLAAVLAALLPSAAQAAAYGPTGADGEKVNITPDGYNEPFRLEGRHYQVAGTGFIFPDPVHIFQCAVTNSVKLHEDCQPLGVAPTTPTLGSPIKGEFSATVFMRQSFSSENRPYNPWIIDDAPFGTEVGGTTCFGRLGVQCAVVAAQFNENGLDLPSSRAEHYICFEGTAEDTLCQTQLTIRWW